MIETDPVPAVVGLLRLVGPLRVAEGEEAAHEVVMGGPVKVHFVGTDRTRTYIIVTEEELEEVEGGASADSPIGVALLGKKVGDVVELEGPNGTAKLEVLAIGDDV